MKKTIIMKWLDDNLRVISFVWWLLQGFLLLLNELRVWFEHNYLTYSILLLSICLIAVSFLLWLVRNKKIVLLFSFLLLLYSVLLLVFFSVLFILESHGNKLVGIFFVVPILNILLSILMLGNLRKEI